MISREFEKFLQLSRTFYHSIGVTPFIQFEGRKRSWWMPIVFCLFFINLNVEFFGECIFCVLAFRNGSFLEATTALSYIGFVSIAEFKLLYLWLKRHKMTQFLRDLYAIFPKTRNELNDFHMKRYLFNYRVITLSFSILYMVLIWTYNLLAMAEYLIYELWLRAGVVVTRMPYLVCYPWEWRNNWLYYPLYASEAMAGYTSAASSVANNMLFAATATQLIIHFDAISRRIRKYRTNILKGEDDVKHLSELIEYHNNIMRLTQHTNDLFGIPLFFNFLASCFVICFVGFLLTVGVDTSAMIKLFLFLISAIAEVYLICHFGQEVIDASSRVSSAVYEQNWLAADVRYKKMLVLIAARAQNPAILTATSFIRISHDTMTVLMQFSYKFYALLRTMYASN